MPANLASQVDPLANAFVITPSDSTVFHNTRSVYNAVEGNVTMLFAGDTVPVLFTSLPAGEHPFNITKVMSTGTGSNLGLVGMY